MGGSGTVISRKSLAQSTLLRRRRPRSFTEWSTLRRWHKLPVWEVDVPGYLLREARQQAGLTQQMLAEGLGITQQAVSRAEGWSSNPTIDLMRRWLADCGFRLGLRFTPLDATISESDTTVSKAAGHPD